MLAILLCRIFTYFAKKMDTLLIIAIIAAAYLIGSIPTAVWVGKIFFNIDIREHGSKNAGATNTIRVLGVKAGLPVFIIDVLKGFFAVNLATFIDISQSSEVIILIQLALGFAALLGHIFPIFAQFRGGKGVATLAGVVLALHPFATATAFGIFVLVVILTRYVSLGSMVAGLIFPFIIEFLFNNSSHTLLIFSIIVALLLIVTHIKNIKRLVKGEESKFRFNKHNNTTT